MQRFQNGRTSGMSQLAGDVALGVEELDLES